MANILALDTATAACSAALCVGDDRFSEYRLEPQSHTRLILPMIDSLVSRAGITLKDIDLITFTHGPGSFTGIRIGFGVVQGLAFGSGIPVVPVSTLALMAASAARKLSNRLDGVITPALDARMGEVYLGKYQVTSSGVKAVQPDNILPVAEVQRYLSGNPDVLCIGDGWSLVDLRQAPTGAVITDFYPEAEDLIDIAERDLLRGNTTSIKGLEPLYLRDKVGWRKRIRLRQ